jgi:RNA polymerase sigma factor (sigma-70 family)
VDTHEDEVGHSVAVKADVAGLVEAARRGDQRAWEELVELYMPLVLSVTRRYRLESVDAADVNQTLWLRLVEHLDDIREPERLAGWIATTVRNEALRLLASRKRTVIVDPQTGLGLEPDLGAGPSVDEDLLRAERHQALREGLRQLRPTYRELLVLLSTDPPPSYDQISERLGIPRGSIGPTRARAVAELRSTAALRDLVGSGT